MKQERKNIQVLQKRVAVVVVVVFLLGQVGIMMLLGPLPRLAVAFAAVPIITWLCVLWCHYGDREGRCELVFPVATGHLTSLVSALLMGLSASSDLAILAFSIPIIMASLLLVWIRQTDRLIEISLLELRCPDMLMLREEELWTLAREYGAPKNVPWELQLEINKIGKARFWGHY